MIIIEKNNIWDKSFQSVKEEHFLFLEEHLRQEDVMKVHI